MDKIILRRFKRPEPQKGRVIKVDDNVYNRLSEISEDTSIPMQRLTTLLLGIALDNVVIVDNEEEIKNAD